MRRTARLSEALPWVSMTRAEARKVPEACAAAGVELNRVAAMNAPATLPQPTLSESLDR